MWLSHSRGGRSNFDSVHFNFNGRDTEPKPIAIPGPADRACADGGDIATVEMEMASSESPQVGSVGVAIMMVKMEIASCAHGGDGVSETGSPTHVDIVY